MKDSKAVQAANGISEIVNQLTDVSHTQQNPDIAVINLITGK